MESLRFACLCELCDCGRHKRHKNCKKRSRPAPQDCRRPQLSHYKATYTQPPSKRGEPKQPPLGAFYTCPVRLPVTSSLFLPSRRASSKQQEAAPHPSTPQPPGHGLQHHAAGRVHSLGAGPEDQAACPGALLSPDRAAEMESTTQREFTEKRIPKPELVKGLQAQLTIEGDHDMTTTHQSTYQSVPLEKRVAQSRGKGVVPAGKRAQVEYMTKYQSDFPACSLLPARIQPAQPPLDNLAINQGFSTDFQTVQRESYHGWDTRRYPRACPIKLKEELADLGKERDGKFSGDTVTKLSYPPLPLDRPPGTIQWPPTVLRSLPAKFDDSTAHKFFFREWRVQPRIRQGDPHDGVYIRPLGKFESQTTTHSTFLPQRAEKVKNCKPEQKPIQAQGKQDFSTIHRESYRPIPLPVCRLQMYLIQQQQQGRETMNSLVPVKA
nr:uncharacterized protein LOC101932618 isoform X4 [Chrysemys picta bellii]